MSAALSALYSSQPLFVWVEDEPTRIALQTAWAGDPVAIHVGGGNETIRAVCEDAWRNHVTHVFGVVDRDHGRSNFAKWAAPGNDLRVYVLQSPEVETIALDVPAIANCSYNVAKRTEVEIDAKLTQIASAMNWWMACCLVIMRVREGRNEGFPSFPKVAGVQTEVAANSHILTSDWFGRVAATLPGYSQPAWVAGELRAEEAKLSTAIANNTWRDLISGKEVLKQLAEYVIPGGMPEKSNTLLQAVVQEQVTSGRVPAELVALRTSLRSRVSLSP